MPKLQWAAVGFFFMLTSDMIDSTLTATILDSSDSGNPYKQNTVTYAKSCKDLYNKYGVRQDGFYQLTSSIGLTYLTFCDMTTSGGGWTLVASVHENNMNGKCTEGDHWSSQQRNDLNQPHGDGSWSNRVTFGTADAATSDDYKNPGYYDIIADDVSVWHVPNNNPVNYGKTSSILKYHTKNKFLSLYGGNLYGLFQRYPLKYGAGSCGVDTGPVIPIVYDFGNTESTAKLYGPFARNEFEAGYISFRVFNYERAALAVCSGVKPKGCNLEHFCVGGGGYFPEGAGRQCGDFTGFDWDGYGTGIGWSASKEMTESAMLIFYK